MAVNSPTRTATAATPSGASSWADGGWFSDRIVGTRKANAVSGGAGGDTIRVGGGDGSGYDSCPDTNGRNRIHCELP
jgi:hypothetical protein